MTLQEFKKNFEIIRNRGFIPSLRKGTTGIGFTFEEILKLRENNLAIPDIKGIEIKTHREGSSNMITLFTFNNKSWIMNPLEAIKKYGSKDQNGRLGMYYTMTLTPNSAGLFLKVEKNVIMVQHTSGEIITRWYLDDLSIRFRQKIPALLFVSARVEERDGKEYYYYYRAQLMEGTQTVLLKDLFNNGDILVDLRLHEQATSARNHGTGFRVVEKKLPKLFNSVKDI